jgi:hypothetical protein
VDELYVSRDSLDYSNKPPINRWEAYCCGNLFKHLCREHSLISSSIPRSAGDFVSHRLCLCTSDFERKGPSQSSVHQTCSVSLAAILV